MRTLLGSSSISRTDITHAYCLRRELNVWQLRFDGQPAFLRHERGVPYVAWLLANSSLLPIHALDLDTKVRQPSRAAKGPIELMDLATGHVEPVLLGSRLQERGLGLDDLETTRALYRKREELEFVIEDPDETEPVKAEALRELEVLEGFLRQGHRGSPSQVRRTNQAIQTAIRRFHRHLAAAVNAAGQPHGVLRDFGAHLQQHLIYPSSRYCRRRQHGRLGNAGCFTYEPPAGVAWAAD